MLYKLLGITRLPGEADTVQFVDSPAFKITTKLTSNPEPHCFHVDRASALAIQLGKGLFNPNKKGTLEERLAEEIHDVRANRQAKCGTGIFLIFEGTDDIKSPDFQSRRDTDDFSICFNAFSRGVLGNKFYPMLHGVISALSMALPGRTDARIEKIGDVGYFVDPDSGKVIYNFSIVGSAPSISIAIPLSEDQIEHARSRAHIFHANGNLANVANLLVESLETKTDDFMAFISAWSSLEIFVKTMFKFAYEKQWCKNMPNSYNKQYLTHKFFLIASVLDPLHAKIDEKIFKDLYKIRNALFHEGQVENYPVEEIQKILRKYVDLHISAQSALGQNNHHP